MKTISIIICAVLLAFTGIKAQSDHTPNSISPSEAAFLQALANQMCETDQQYRNQLSNKTTDPVILARIDSVFETHGIQAGLQYRKSLNLKLSKALKDSLWSLQHALDFQNHLVFRGIIETYGWLPETILGEAHYIQHLLLLHPPKDWNIRAYLRHYAELLLPEVEAGRMPAQSFASFYDNMKGKILREPQLYGTNEQFDPKTGKILPPMILDLAASNQAREAIGLPALQEGEYRLADD